MGFDLLNWIKKKPQWICFKLLIALFVMVSISVISPNVWGAVIGALVGAIIISIEVY